MGTPIRLTLDELPWKAPATQPVRLTLDDLPEMTPLTGPTLLAMDDLPGPTPERSRPAQYQYPGAMAGIPSTAMPTPGGETGEYWAKKGIKGVLGMGNTVAGAWLEMLGQAGASVLHRVRQGGVPGVPGVPFVMPSTDLEEYATRTLDAFRRPPLENPLAGHAERVAGVLDPIIEHPAIRPDPKVENAEYLKLLKKGDAGTIAKKMVGDAIEFMPNIGASVVAWMLGGPLAAGAAGGFLEGGAAYAQAVKSGMDPEEALVRYGGAFAGLTSFLNAIPFGKFLKTGKGLAGKAMTAGWRALTEAGTEVMEGPAEELASIKKAPVTHEDRMELLDDLVKAAWEESAVAPGAALTSLLIPGGGGTQAVRAKWLQVDPEIAAELRRVVSEQQQGFLAGTPQEEQAANAEAIRAHERQLQEERAVEQGRQEEGRLDLQREAEAQPEARQRQAPVAPIPAPPVAPTAQTPAPPASTTPRPEIAAPAPRKALPQAVPEPTAPVPIEKVSKQPKKKVRKSSNVDGASVFVAAVDAGGTPMGIAELARKAGLSEAATREALGPLLDDGMLVGSEEGKYVLGPEHQDLVSTVPPRVGFTDQSGRKPITGKPVTVWGFRGYGRNDRTSAYAEGAGPILGPAQYYAPQKSEAEVFGPQVEKREITLNNPLVLSGEKDAYSLEGVGMPEKRTLSDIKRFAQRLRTYVETKGYDGVIVNVDPNQKPWREIWGGSQVVVFEQAREGDRYVSGQPQAPSAVPEHLADIPGIRVSGNYFILPEEQISVDAHRFQFKIDEVQRSGATATSTVTNAKVWDEGSAGPLLVWRDPVDRKAYVTDGHNRLAKGRKFGRKEFQIEFSKQPTAELARAEAALRNIRQGNGTSIDAAKFFRDTGLSREEAEDAGLSLTDTKVEEGMGLSRLHPVLFDEVVQHGELTAKQGAIIGGIIEDQGMQFDFFSKLRKRKKAPTLTTLKEAAERFARADVVEVEVDEEGPMLPGMPAKKKQSTLFEESEVSAYVLQRLGKEKRTFGGAAKNAEMLARAGNIIDKEESKRLSDSAKANIVIFDAFKYTDEVKRIFRDAATTILEGGDASQAKVEAYDRLTSTLQTLVRRGKTNPLPGHTAPEAAGGVGQPEAQDEAEAVAEPGQADLFGAPQGGTSTSASAAAAPGQSEGPMGAPRQGPQATASANEAAPAVIELPELTKMAVAMGKGRFPTVKKKLRAFRGQALGQFIGDKTDSHIDLKADIFIGPTIHGMAFKARPTREAMDEYRAKVAEAAGLEPDEVHIERDYNKKRRKHMLVAYKLDPTYANRAMAHEIGHWIDFVPEKTMARGNILGRIASLKKCLTTLLKEAPNSAKDIITPKERRKMRAQIAREVRRQAGKGADKNQINDEVRAQYAEWLEAEIDRRGLWSRDRIMNELKDLTQWWKPFDETADPSHTKYRYSPKELYADALSVLMNNPDEFAKRAPMFHRAFLNYLERKPAVKKLYEGIQNEIYQGGLDKTRLDDLRQMMKKGHEKRNELAVQSKEPFSLRKLVKDVEKHLVDSRAHIPKTGAKETDPRAWTSEVVYLPAKAQQLMRDVDEFVRKPLAAAGIDLTDIDQNDFAVFLAQRRAATERAHLANPLGIRGEHSVGVLGEQFKQLGPERYQAMLDAADTFLRIRQWYTFPILKQSRLFSEELMEHIEANEDYVTYNVQEYLDQQHGQGTTAHIYKQIGTLKEIEDPLTATIMKDISLIKAATVNIAKTMLVEEMQESSPELVQDAPKEWDGQRLDFSKKPPKGQEKKTLFVWSVDGKPQGVWIPQEVAEWFDADPVGAGLIFRFLRGTMRPFKSAYTEYSIGFGFHNVLKDYRRTIKNLPGFQIYGVSKQYVRGFNDAFLDAFFDKSTPFVQTMHFEGELIEDMGWRGREHDDRGDTQYARMAERFAASPKKQEAMWKSIGAAFFRFTRRLNKFHERWSKIAAKRVLLEQGTYAKEGMQAKENIRGVYGSPDFKAMGRDLPILNAFYMFPNPKIQGMRTNIQAASKEPVAYGLKVLTLDILPKMVLWSMGTGAFDQALRFLTGWEEDDEEGSYYQRMVSGIPEHDLQNYTCIPWYIDEEGRTVYSAVPSDHVGQLVGNLTWNALKQSEGALPSELMDSIISQNPFSSTSKHPLFSLGQDIATYMAGKNPYNYYYGTYALDQTSFDAGGLTAWKQLAKYEFNRIAGSVTRFKSRTAKMSGDDASALDLPYIGPTLRRFIRVSSKGHDDIERRKGQLAASADAKLRAVRRDIIAEYVALEKTEKKRGVKPKRSAMFRAWEAAKEAEAVPKGYKYAYFKASYESAKVFAGDDPEAKAALRRARH